MDMAFRDKQDIIPVPNVIVTMVVWVWCGLCPLANGSTPEPAPSHRVPKASFLSFFRDATGGMSLEQARQGRDLGHFTPLVGYKAAFGFTTDAIWLHLTLENPSENADSWILELQTPRLDSVESHLVRSNGSVEHHVAGNMSSSDRVTGKAINPNFPFLLHAGEKVECFLRVQSETSLRLPLRWVPADEYEGITARETSPYYVFFGWLAALILLGFMFGRSWKELGSTAYSLSLLAMGTSFFILSGNWVREGLPDPHWIHKQGVILLGEISVLCHLKFLRKLLDLRVKSPLLERWVVRIEVLGVFITFVFLLMPFRHALPLFVVYLLLFLLGCFITSIFIWSRGVRVARFYCLAWAAFWAGNIHGFFQFLVAHPDSLAPWKIGLVAVALSSALFMFAITDRLQLLLKAHDLALKDLKKARIDYEEEFQSNLRRDQILIRDLHDGIGGLTANLAIMAELGRRKSRSPIDRECLECISILASDGASEIRRLMKSLENREMLWQDLFDEIKRHARLTLQTQAIEFNFEIINEMENQGPGVHAGISLMNVLKEAINNAMKHAACTRISVEAKFDFRQLTIKVHDNGRGMVERPSGGRGMNNMVSRLREIGGSVLVKGEAGLELTLCIPLPVRFVNSDSNPPDLMGRQP